MLVQRNLIVDRGLWASHLDAFCGQIRFLSGDVKDLLARFVNAVTMELDIDCKGAGETPWKRPEIARGLAADQCYYFEAGKPAAVAAARARKSNDVADYPNPDLAIEVDLSPPEIDRAGIYAALKVVFVGIGGQSPLLQRGDASARGFVGAGSVRRSQAARIVLRCLRGRIYAAWSPGPRCVDPFQSSNSATKPRNGISPAR